MATKANSILASYSSKSQSILSDYGLDELSKKRQALQADADRFSSYINSGNYTTADQQTHRKAMTSAVTDLDAKMAKYEKSSDEYKLYDTYRNYFNNALTSLDRTDVIATGHDYLNDKTWHDADYRKNYYTSLQNSINALSAEMDAMEDKTSDEYKQLAYFRDYYGRLSGAAQKRDKFDSQFKDADDYTAFT